MSIKLCPISSIRGILVYLERVKAKNTGIARNKLSVYKHLS